MLPSQRALFDIPRDVCFLNAAAWSPLPLASQEAGRAAVGAQGPAVEAGDDFQSAAVRARPQGGRGADRRRSRRRRPDLLGRLRRVDRGQGPGDPARQPGAGAGGRSHLAGAGMDRPRRGRRLHGRDGEAADRRRLDLRGARRRSSAPGAAPLALVSISSVHWSDGGALDMPRIAHGGEEARAPRCWSTPRTMPACATST